jgi:membrane-associated phospholipid phosphatase
MILWLILAALAPLYVYLNSFLDYIEQRPGCDLNDAVLQILPSHDLSHIIFFFLYTSSLFMILYCLRQPWLLIRGFHVLIVLQYLRNICLFLSPLNAPVDIHPLQDPFLEAIAYNDQCKLKDLFFSGHTATIFIFALLIWDRPVLRLIFGFITVLMAILLLIQHCHYTIDIIGGVAFAYLSFDLIRGLWRKAGLKLQ